ncbi:MAG: type II toxin-antitoxin system mRNA interferase toxin, RelE/StbE family [Candidatus Pacebacteria bacterium CG10_big_fil_rev_8_21_14_0_10_42_12]|nr:MAG: type II toxin-antitoxin system mRNA interferase toxin, RelE/StbE family [Candidatus Pacebacteria bacterium CG10_big_fil_rev_8_21_14_0_10_42_12]
MKIVSSKKFEKSYKKRVAPNNNLVSKFRSRLDLFMVNSQDPVLRDHLLRGEKRSYRAFSVTGDIRVIYSKKDDKCVLLDIGSHNQVY